MNLAHRSVETAIVLSVALFLAGCSINAPAFDNLPKTDSIYEWCTEVFDRASITQFNESHGVDVGSESDSSLNANNNLTVYGDGFACTGERTLIVVVKASDEAKAEHMAKGLQNRDELFPTRESISLKGAEGQFSYYSNPSGTRSSFSVERDTLVISIMHQAVSAEPSESDVKDLLYRIADLSLSMPLPPLPWE